MKYDAIVVGAGIAGLTAAAYLSRAGKKVLLLERQYKTGGLVQTFHRDNVYFDGGLRSIENSGIVFPMLRQLGIEVDFVKSPVSVGIAESVLKLTGAESLVDYEKFLQSHYPDNKKDVSLIIKEIKKIMDYMDVLYGIDNPAFLNLKEDKEYLLKVILPWMFKFLPTISKINRLNEPVDEYLKRFTTNQSLIDVIAQHFFQKTPTSFALSYFRLYLDYFYPKGGTATLINKMTEFAVQHGTEIRTSTIVTSLHPEEKFVMDNFGNKIEYHDLIWAGDMKLLYDIIPVEQLKDKKLKQKIIDKILLIKDLKGGDSIFTVYMTVNENKEYFDEISSGHFFYTPSKIGLSTLSTEFFNRFIKNDFSESELNDVKIKLKKYLNDYCELNTYEISIPVLRDESMAPKGKVGLIVSLLFDYELAKKIEDLGWSEEIKVFLERKTIEVLDKSIYPGIEKKTAAWFSSSPLTIEKLTGNTQGGITGWAFTNPVIPAGSKMLKVAKSVETVLPSVFQAGQWVFSPSGFPISVLTGKLAADKVLSKS